uniref:U3 small nucleolar ribonucleoprotein protein MPP10 n=1 Tax=Daphnia similis TaxID=35528 RepID=A0A4Y7LRQ7_9CRUS|nr:EOG090X09DZ [Daphnia similis]SVE71167.1 EOG090X09DZ [Daphnia similis]SVE72425.1 EOG090X09DZ [Daphnia similis]
MAAHSESLVDRVLNEFTALTTKPESFLSVQTAANTKFKAITKDLYDSVNRNFALQGLTRSLPELYIDGFDEEQIWQQLELHNEPCFNILVKNVAKLLSGKDKKLTFYKVEVQADDAEEEENVKENEQDKDSVASDLSFELPADSDNDESGHDDDSDLDETGDLKFDEYKMLDEEREERPKKNKEQSMGKIRQTEVDDEFFKVGEMEKFLEKEEAEKPSVDDDDAESIDYFEDVLSDDDENDAAIRAKYKDFFRGSIPAGDRKSTSNHDGEDLEENNEDDEEIEEQDDDAEPREKRVKFDLNGSESEESGSDTSIRNLTKSDVKSNYEQRQERLKAKIQELEDEAVAPKPWQLMGETKAELRPDNALLEEDLFFDHTTRQAPVITEETTRTLEEIIRQRIKDQAFDDVERKIKPVYDPTEYKKKLVLDQEKSKYSLAEIYEQEFLKQQEIQKLEAKSSSLADAANDEPSDDQNRAALRKRMANVFAKLDALCNFSYTPRAAQPDIKIVSNMPSIVMEEIAPVTVSDANLLAPQEVQDPTRGVLKGKTEKEKTDLLRERRKKKSAQRVRHKERERTEKAVDKANPGLGNKHAKARVIRNLQKAEKEGTVSLIKENRMKAPRSSTAFFRQLQEDVSASVDAVRNNKQKSSLKNKRTSAVSDASTEKVLCLSGAAFDARKKKEEDGVGCAVERRVVPVMTKRLACETGIERSEQTSTSGTSLAFHPGYAVIVFIEHSTIEK